MEYKIIYNNTYISCFIFGNNKNIVLAPGLPQYIDKYHPVVEQAKILQCNLFIPRYYGTHEDPKPKMTLKGCKKAIENTVELVGKMEATELFSSQKITWNNPTSVVIGFSFGALPALMQNLEVTKTILYCPFVSLNFHGQNSSGEVLTQTLAFLEKAFPGSYRFDCSAFLKEISSAQLPNTKDNLSIVKTADDDVVPNEEINFIAQKYNCPIIKKPGKHKIFLFEDIL